MKLVAMRTKRESITRYFAALRRDEPARVALHGRRRAPAGDRGLDVEIKDAGGDRPHGSSAARRRP